MLRQGCDRLIGGPARWREREKEKVSEGGRESMDVCMCERARVRERESMIFLCVNEFECVSADKEIEANYRDLLHDVMLSMSTRALIHYDHHYHRLHYNYITDNNDKNNIINNYKILRTSK